ncbi:DUF3881 family protein [Mordavella massiliensis]|uniref:DUF3881 family protein n=1 Tax=Mordavella massiliensis TaxID=1871024 RepID=A0A938XCW0_9CLOT|nr:DUF3881 family protein [Mordavella massiliensis]MBM6949161.1 DUF3881 family protein [Mordavella massiliensis]
MHRYLRSIGFGRIRSRRELNEFLSSVEKNYTCHELTALDEEADFCEYQRECGPGIGVAVCGDMDVREHFYRQYYYPYFIGSGISSYADIVVEKRMDREAYVGICEDMKVGVSLIFHLQNTVEYIRERQLAGDGVNFSSVTLAGLCESGMVLLPVRKSREAQRRSREESRNRMMLLSAARNGDQTAMESLTLDDIDIYSKVSKRLVTEDVFSIVDTYFMPCGVECDRYSILGEILNVHTTENQETGEELYIMKLDVNELEFDVCVPVRDVFGEPAKGRRFKADIWLQGRINF